jgi:hypothetical protein
MMPPRESGRAGLDALGQPAARELLGAITRGDADRAALIDRLYARAGRGRAAPPTAFRERLRSWPPDRHLLIALIAPTRFRRTTR